VETEENQTQVSLSSHRPWKSLLDFHIPTEPITFPFFPPETNQKNHRKEPSGPPSLLHPFRLILGLENAEATPKKADQFSRQAYG